MEEDKKVIEEELFIKEEDRQLNVRELSQSIKKYLKIDSLTKQIVFSNEIESLSNYEGIAILLTGIYLGHKAGVFQKKGLSLPEISEKLRVVQTTLSAPVNTLIKNHFVIPSEDKKSREYTINELSIKSLLDDINSSDTKTKHD